MIGRLVFAELRNRPGRAAFLLAGYAFGVAVMVVLLAVGEAMLTQARDGSLVGGGDVLVLPAGVSPEMLKAGGTTALFAGIDQARFIQRQVLESPRGREEYGVIAASPLIDGRLVRMSAGGVERQVLASGEIPGRAAAVGAAPDLIAGRWDDSEADRQWVSPSTADFLDEIDAFHVPYGVAVGDSTWAEWHYFDVVLARDRWLHLTFLVGGRIGSNGGWGGQVILTTYDPVAGYVTRTRDVDSSTIRFDTMTADVVLDRETTVRQRGGRYEVRAAVDGSEIELTIEPLPNRYFPPTELGGADLVSGYVVPVLAGRATGRVCLAGRDASEKCEDVEAAHAYHDHNWGVWRDVGWEWGAASDEELSLLYGVVRTAGQPGPPLFAYLADSRGVRGVFRPGPLEITGSRPTTVGGRVLQVPTGLRFEDSRRGLAVDISIVDAQVTDTEREEDRYFVQMRGRATVRQRGFEDRILDGFFETYVE